jgi:hypothetical protein
MALINSKTSLTLEASVSSVYKREYEF